MSQKTTHTPESRFQAVVDVKELVEQGYSSTEACNELGISPDSYRRWRDKLAKNPAWVKQRRVYDDSRRPKRIARELNENTKQRIIETAKQPHHQSAHSIAKQLRTEGIRIGNGAVNKILVEAGLFGEIYVQKPDGTYVRKMGLLRLCQKRQQGFQKDESNET